MLKKKDANIFMLEIAIQNLDNKLTKANNIIESLKLELIQAESLMKNKDFEVYTLKSDIDKLNDRINVKDMENKSLRMMGFHMNPTSIPSMSNEREQSAATPAMGKSKANIPIGIINQDTLRQMMVKNKAARKKKAKAKVKEYEAKESEKKRTC